MARHAAQVAWVGVEACGEPTAFVPFPTPIARIEASGTPVCLSSTGKLVLLNHPGNEHLIGITGFCGPAPECCVCSGKWAN